MMKKLMFWCLLSVMALGFGGCSEDDEGVGSASMLVGLWETVSYYELEKEDGEIVYEETYMESDGRVEFKSDGTFLAYWKGRNGWELDNEGEWEYKSGKIYTKGYEEDGGDLMDIATVEELSSSTLVVSFSEKDEGYEYYVEETYRRVE